MSTFVTKKGQFVKCFIIFDPPGNYNMLNSARILIVLSLLGLVSDMYSQQLSHQVLVPVAGVTTTGSLTYSQTIGETAVEIIASPDYTFTQGFQQPCIKFSRENPPPGNGAKVYPNPVTDYLNVELFGNISRTFQIEIINISGTIVISERLVFTGMYWNTQQIPVRKLGNGLYFVRILSEDGVISQIFKIEKM